MFYTLEVKYKDKRNENILYLIMKSFSNQDKEKAIENKRRLDMALNYWTREFTEEEIEERDFIQFNNWDMDEIKGVRLVADDGEETCINLRDMFPIDILDKSEKEKNSLTLESIEVNILESER